MPKKLVIVFAIISLLLISKIFTHPLPSNAETASSGPFCDFTPNGTPTGDVTLNNDCVIYEDVNGPAVGNLIVNGATITLYRTLVWYPSYSIKLQNNAHIIVNDNSQIVQRKICLKDSNQNGVPGTSYLTVNPNTGQPISPTPSTGSLTQLDIKYSDQSGTCPSGYYPRETFSSLAYVDVDDSSTPTTSYSSDVALMNMGFSINGVTNVLATTGDVVVGDSKNLIIDSPGMLGIGTSSPNYSVDVTGGDVNITNGQYYRAERNTSSSSIPILGFPTGSDVLTMEGGGSSGNIFQLIATNSNPLVTVTGGGYVGIGTTTPGYTLDLAGSQRLGNTNAIYFRNAADTADVRAVTVDANDNVRIGSGANSSSTDINFDIASANGGNVMIIKGDSGDVGIGNTAPGYPLDVTGTARATMNGAMLAMKNSSSGHQWEWYSGGSVGTNSLGLYDRTNSAYRLSLNNSGYFGIGTTNADSPLEVSGAGHVTGNLTVDTDLYLNGAGDAINFGSGWATMGYTDGNGRFSIYENATGCSSCTYTNTEQAMRMTMNTGGIDFYTAPSGTAGNSITWSRELGIDDGSVTVDNALGAGGAANTSYSLKTYGNILMSSGTAIYSGYNNDYIIRDLGNSNVTISAAGGTLYLGYHNTPSLSFYTQGTQDAYFDSAGDLYMNNDIYSIGWYGRQHHGSGGLVGSYNNVGNNANYTNPIYTIGTNYEPSDSSWGNMYGVGYTNSNSGGMLSSFYNAGSHGGWGMYAIAAGTPRIFLNAGDGTAQFYNRISVGDGSAPYSGTGTAGVWFSHSGSNDWFVGNESSSTSPDWGIWNSTGFVMTFGHPDASNYQTITMDAKSTTSGPLFKVNNSQTNAASAGIGVEFTGASSNGVDFMRFVRSGTKIGHIYQATSTTVTYQTNGSDYAEYFPSVPNSSLQKGYLMAMDQTIQKASKADPENNSSLLGVITTAPGFGGNGSHDSDPNYAHIGILGQIPTIVSSANGPIKPGDAIAASSTAGVGVKATSDGYVIGTAIQPFVVDTGSCKSADSLNTIIWPYDDGSNQAKPCFKLPNNVYVGKIMVFVKPFYYIRNPDALNQKINDLQSENQKLETKVQKLEQQIQNINAKLGIN